MSRLLLLFAFVTMGLTVVPACDSSESEPAAADAGSDGRDDAGTKGGKKICHCPGSCGMPDQDVEWPADDDCRRGACDGISNCLDLDAGDGG